MNNDSIDVSVILPNYNHAPFLRERFESILSQGFQNFEIILLDDGSSDGSRELLDEYANHPKVSHYVKNTENSGSTFIQWARGLSLASGTCIWIAESDDVAHPEFLQTCLDTLNGDEELGLVYCQSFVIDSQSRMKGVNTSYTDYLDREKWLHDYTARGLTEINNFMILRNIIPNVSAVLFRKDVLRLPEDLSRFSYLGDWYLYCSILLRCKLAYVSTPLNYYRVHKGTVRSKALLNGTRIKEYYALLGFLARHKEVHRKTLWRQFLVNSVSWVRLSLKIPVRTHGSIAHHGLRCLLAFMRPRFS